MAGNLCFDYNNFKYILELFELSIEDVYFEASYGGKVSGLFVYMYWISPASALNYFQDHQKLEGPDGNLYMLSVLVKGTWCELEGDADKPFEDYLEGEVVELIKAKKHVVCKVWVNGSGAGTLGDNWRIVRETSS